MTTTDLLFFATARTLLQLLTERDDWSGRDLRAALDERSYGGDAVPGPMFYWMMAMLEDHNLVAKRDEDLAIRDLTLKESYYRITDSGRLEASKFPGGLEDVRGL
jgi:DNA-binding PadR family transcriptional regulator